MSENILGNESLETKSEPKIAPEMTKIKDSKDSSTFLMTSKSIIFTEPGQQSKIIILLHPFINFWNLRDVITKFHQALLIIR